MSWLNISYLPSSEGKRRTMLILLTIASQLVALKTIAQVNYYSQIKGLAENSITDNQLLFKLDSLKQTRRPTSYVRVSIDRDIDFGYRQKMIEVQLNGADYHLNLLVKNDTIVMKRVLYSTLMFMDSRLEQFNSSNKYFQIDTNKVTQFLHLRNKYYGSKKNIDSLKKDLGMYVQYSISCGDGNLKSPEWVHIENLAKKRDIKSLTLLLNSLLCEQQAYGVSGFKLLRKSGYKIPRKIKAIVNHIEKRNSALMRCEGCFFLIR